MIPTSILIGVPIVLTMWYFSIWCYKQSYKETIPILSIMNLITSIILGVFSWVVGFIMVVLI